MTRRLPCTCKPDRPMCPACEAFDPPDAEWRSDAEERELDATVRWHYAEFSETKEVRR